MSEDKIKVTLGGVEYSVPALDMDQYEELKKHWDLNPEGIAGTKGMAEIVLRDADPKIERIGKLRCTPLQLQRACNDILTGSGLEAQAKSGEPQAAEDSTSTS